MRLLVICIITAYFVCLTTARLVQRVTEKPNVEMSLNVEKIDLSSSKKGDGHKNINFHKEQVRFPREDEKTEIPNVTKSNLNPPEKSKKVLVKKPIPRYKYIESDEDYQSKLSKNRWQFDNVEHEDEDFSIDDYDFDVNHDEFVGRGKPLEPRKELKNANQVKKTKQVQINKRNIVTHRTSNLDDEVHKYFIKRTRKTDNKMLDDRHKDELHTTSNILAKESPTIFNEDSDEEIESSSEYHNSVRTARSPWNIRGYADKIGKRTSAFVSKILSFLPVFPQLPDQRKIDRAHSKHLITKY